MKKLLIIAMAGSFASAFAFDAGEYYNKNCAACHTIGGGDKIGPDLAGVSKRRKIDWLVKYINYPTGMMQGDAEEPGYEKADPVAAKLWEAYKPMTMTEFEVSKDQVKAIVKYIDDQKKEPKGKILKIK